ncbi:hypothetical protein ACFX1X_026156 [Malus domestica]
MAASLTISRLLRAPKSLVFSTITTAAAPKTSLFSPKSFSSKISYTPLIRFFTAPFKSISATIAVCDKRPEATLSYLDGKRPSPTSMRAV